MSEVKTYSRDIAGKTLSVEIGRLAKLANGSVKVQYGETTVLVTAVMSPNPVQGKDFFPFVVDYEERYYAAGKIKDSKWMKREGKPADEAILSARLIDRSLRPRFDHGIRNEVQIVATVLGFDGENDPDLVALFGGSLALMISDIPFSGPVAGARVNRVNGKFVLNPIYAERKESDLELFIGGTANRINMIEASAKIVKEKDVVEAAELAFKLVKELTDFQNEIVKDFPVKKAELQTVKRDEAIVTLVRDFSADRLADALYVPGKSKGEFYEGLSTIKSDLMDHLKELWKEDHEIDKKLDEASVVFEEEIDRIVHKNVLEGDKRPDGRKLDQLRDISVDVGIVPRVHGTGLFNRGDTQALSILTLASPGAEQWIETMEIDLTKKRFMHHYVFPPFSVGETGRVGGAGRRDIGHGFLAERALEPIIPSQDEFPYTIRLVSEILGSNGSSSMASVCGSSLALMDGGVPIKSPAAGIAMGVMFDEKGEKYKILTDIQGPEDHHGDMDLKVAGTKDGVTAMQMDVKIEGITPKILGEAIEQAKKARLEILDIINAKISAPRSELSKNAPRIEVIKINPDKIGAVIGSQGKVINGIIEQTGVQIDIDDDGSVFITSKGPEGMAEAKRMIEAITYEPNVGDEFDGTVVGIKDFGAFVELYPGKDGMVHISEMSEKRVEKVTDVLKMGQKVHVRIKKIDDSGKISLTMKN